VNESHIIDSWIAELGLSSRRLRSSEEPVVRQAGAGLDTPRAAGPPTPPERRAHARRPHYQVISSPC
jgi:hypothetical protein